MGLGVCTTGIKNKGRKKVCDWTEEELIGKEN